MWGYFIIIMYVYCLLEYWWVVYIYNTFCVHDKLSEEKRFVETVYGVWLCFEFDK